MPSLIPFALQLPTCHFSLFDYYRFAITCSFFNKRSSCGHRHPSAAVYVDPNLTWSFTIFSLVPWPPTMRRGPVLGLHLALLPVVLVVPLVLLRTPP